MSQVNCESDGSVIPGRMTETELRFRRLFQASKDGILVLDADTGKILDVNPFLMNMTGFSREEFMGKYIWEVGSFEDVPSTRALFAELSSNSSVHHEDLQMKDRDGRSMDVELVSNMYLVQCQSVIQCYIRDISAQKRGRKRDRLTRDLLESLARHEAGVDPIRDILRMIKNSTGLDAVGIRLREGEDFPYHVTTGFAEEFVIDERSLCACDHEGKIVRDEAGCPVHECMCGSVLCGRTDPELSYFSEGGSFWTNSTSELLAATTEQDRLARIRNRCIGEGYESVALIPLRSRGGIIGLLQLNDRRRDRFDMEQIRFLEGVGSTIGIALERKRDEDGLRFRNLILSTQQELSLDGILVVDVNGEIVSSNRRFAEMWRIPPDVMQSGSEERAMQSVMDNLSDPEGFVSTVKHLHASTQEDRMDEISLHDGRTFDRFSAPMQDADGKHLGRVWYYRDITERRKAESEMRLKDCAMETSITGIAIIDLQGTLTCVNAAFARMHGYEQSELIGMPCAELWPTQSGEVLEAVFHNGGWTGEQDAQRKDGTTLPVQISISLVKDASGRPIAVMGSFLDISGRREAELEHEKLEEQLRVSQKMEAIGSLAGGVAHDFNNLLSIITGYSALALMDLKDGDPLKASMEEIRRAALSAAKLTQQLLAFGSKQMLSPQVVCINDLISDMETMLVRLIGEDVVPLFCLETDLWNTKIDPGQLEQIVMNLVINARDAMPMGGKLTVETANIELDEEDRARRRIAIEPGPYVVLTVCDTGTGMDPDTLCRIFEPFFTSKDTGTGLGLSTVHGIIKQSGGEIRVFSEPGQGTTFKTFLPRFDGAGDADGITRQEVSDPRGLETVLVVEDEKALLRLISMSLARFGYSVLEASSGDEALGVCAGHGGRIHLMLTDVVMPRMSGRELAILLEKQYPDMPVLYMSGYSDDVVSRHDIIEEGLEFIHKPFMAEAIVSKVREVLDASRARIGHERPMPRGTS